MDIIGKVYDLKDTVQVPEMYLGADISKWKVPDKRECWCSSGKSYIMNSLKLVKGLLATEDLQLPAAKKCNKPMPKVYRPELYVAPEIDGDKVSTYQQLIGILHWGMWNLDG
eukprot:scaffold17519_cov78-Attheya_sp.AAC.2